jgi:oxygen-independent coproporphyrinogen-3 oxidase
MSVASIYIGGGTPSMLTANQIEQLFQTIEQGINKNCQEITFEAGRPDTITIEKIDILKHAGVNRISINPQTFNELTLRKMNRKHSIKDIFNIYEHARKRNFDQINMDLILGLPYESLIDIKNTLQITENLMPESVTVHTLSLKTKSKLKEQIPIEDFRRATDIGRMVEESQAWALSAGYKPYYLYRQKNIAGNLENVGYAKLDKYSLYNIYIMEELMPIIGIGCGSVSKIINASTGKLNRLANPSEPQYYIQHIEEIIDKKHKHLPELLTI